MNGYNINRNIIESCFNKPKLINIEDILLYKVKYNTDYKNGGFYMIKNIENNTVYIGKSINYLARLKQHIYKSSNKTNIDKNLNNNVNNFKFYLLLSYEDVNINFFNRKLETIIEHRFISIALLNGYKIYNSIHYGHL